MTLPPEFKDKVNETQIELIQNKTKEKFKARCEENGGDEAYEKAQVSTTNIALLMWLLHYFIYAYAWSVYKPNTQ